MQKDIYPCLWFDGQAKAAAEFYCELFPNSKIITVTPLVVLWEMNGRKYMGLNGGPKFKFSEAISLVVHCDTQQEIDFYWEKLIADGGAESMCGWCKDKFGLSWQIVPTVLEQLMQEPGRGKRVMEVFLKMKKFDIQALLDA